MLEIEKDYESVKMNGRMKELHSCFRFRFQFLLFFRI